MTGTVSSISETAGGMTVRVITGYTPPPVVTPIIESIDDVQPEWARTALRGAVGKTVTIEQGPDGTVTKTTVRA